ncbi:MAG: TlyA family RNA methyltransferase [Candidatus Woesearchaeota archaeon]
MRLDQLLVKKGLVESREKAKELIKNGLVLVNNKPILKPSKDIDQNSKIEVKESFKYVTRGGYKLEYAVKFFNIEIFDKVCCDIGCSFGGFTDFLIKNSAKKVYAIDNGDVLREELRQNPKVIYFKNTDVLSLTSLPEKVEICTIDVTFESIKDILIHVKNFLNNDSIVLALIKPPFEIEKSDKNKIKKLNEEKSFQIAKEIENYASKIGYDVIGICKSTISGKKGKQIEYFLCLKFKN